MNLYFSKKESAQSCPTLCNPMDCSLPAQSRLILFDPMDCSLSGSSAHGIFQARILEWVAISFSKRSSQPRGWTQVSCIVGRRFTIWATREVHWQVGINTCQDFCHKPYEVTVEPQNRAPHLLPSLAGHVIHSHKHTVELVKYSRKHVC